MTFDLAMTKRQDRTSVDDLFFPNLSCTTTTPPSFLATLECKVKWFCVVFRPEI